MKRWLAALGLGALCASCDRPSRPVGASQDAQDGGTPIAASERAEPDAAVESPARAALAPLFRKRHPAVGPPKYFELAMGVDVSPEEFMRRYAADLWDLTSKDELVPEAPKRGYHPWQSMMDYKQRHGGYAVFEASLTLDVSNGRVVAGSSSVVGGLSVGELRVTDSAARQAACIQLGANPALQRGGDLGIANRRLIWRFAIFTDTQLTAEVDASTGALLQAWDSLDR